MDEEPIGCAPVHVRNNQAPIAAARATTRAVDLDSWNRGQHLDRARAAR